LIDVSDGVLDGVVAPPEIDLLTVTHLSKQFVVAAQRWGRGRDVVHALDDVSFDVRRGETLAIVGESGSGKSTLARVLMGLESPSSGSAQLDGQDLFAIDKSSQRRLRRTMQIVMQDPYGSLNPRMTVFQLISEPWTIHASIIEPRQRESRVADLMTQVGLDPADMHRRATTFSGGQRQRVGIARALALEPACLILDEPVTALDVSVQAQIIEQLRSLQQVRHLTMIFIAHDLGLVRSLADRVAVMYLGRIVELGESESVFSDPKHPYTQALLATIPGMRPRSSGEPGKVSLRGEPPSAVEVPNGCRFHPRCWLTEELGGPEKCMTVDPELRVVGSVRAACHFPEHLGHADE
jgi:oligopeptide transport system ATP-binding protein